jgi:hypothetical protein
VSVLGLLLDNDNRQVVFSLWSCCWAAAQQWGGIFFAPEQRRAFLLVGNKIKSTRKEQKYGHGSRWGSTPRITMLANASSKLLLACLLAVSLPTCPSQFR